MVQDYKLNQEQKDLLFGSLLGDGNLNTETQGRTVRYRALQQEKQKDYLMHKYEVLKDLCDSPPIYGETYDPRTQKIYKRWFFNTRTETSLIFYGNLFYDYDPQSKKFVKKVPLQVEKFLTPRAVAYWYMDDGSLKSKRRSNAMRISTEGFKPEEVSRLRNALRSNFNIETAAHKKHKTAVVNGVETKIYIGDLIYIPEKSSSAFRELIKPYLIDCMRYKVSDGNYGTL
jgi:recombination protein RecA